MVAELSSCEIFVDAQSFNLQSETSVTSFKSKLNPHAKPFRILYDDILPNPFSHAKQFYGMPLKETEVASGNNFPFCDGTSIDMSMPNPLLDCTPQIIIDAMTPDISMRSDSFNKTLDSLQIGESRSVNNGSGQQRVY